MHNKIKFIMHIILYIYKVTMSHKFCFFHHNVNGDCWSSRLIVNHIIKHTEQLKCEYFYNAHRAINSHCEDLGILPEKFNKISQAPDIKGVQYINDVIYLNTWIGYTDNLCVWCLKSLNIYYNTLIQEINNHCELSIPLITSENASDSCIAHIPFDYSKYDLSALEQIKHLIEIKKQTYKKIILIQNYQVTTKLLLNNIDHIQYIHKLSAKYPEYLFMPYMNITSSCSISNIISLDVFFNQIENKDLHRIGMPMIYASYLSILCDKVICLGSGPMLYTFNEENKHIRNKFFLVSTIEDIYGVYVPVCPTNESKELCVNKYNLYYKVHFYSDNNLFLQEVEEFITN